jgi:anti-sigma regulatory factor (Ser/Thr protein kinase)
MGQSAEIIHDAFIYSSDTEFVSTLTPLLQDGLNSEHAAVAAVTRRNIDLLRDSLGTQAGLVTFIDRDDWYRRPAATVAGWEQLLAQAKSRGHSYIRIIGEVAFGERHATWTRYEAALNSVFAGTPAWITCPYDTRALPGSVIADARRTHPVISGPQRSPSGVYERPEQLLHTISEPMPPVAGEPTVTLHLTSTESISDAREILRRVATRGGCPAEKVDEAVIVLSEVAGNSLRHGAGERWLRVWLADGSVVCEVTDEGEGVHDELIGYRPPGSTAEASRGLWLANQLSDWLAVARDNGITRVRFALATL